MEGSRSTPKGDTMPRRMIISKNKIWSRRADNYAKNYQMHCFLLDAYDDETRTRVLNVINQCLPASLDIFGGLDIDMHRAALNKLEQQYGYFKDFGREIFASWLWTKNGWNDYVHKFNNLPHPSGDYEARYNRETDTIEYIPLEKYGKPVDNSRTTTVQLPYKSG
jgi:hypothetical protein